MVALGACTLLLCGCGKTVPTLSDGSQAVVSFNEGTESVSANALYEQMKQDYGLTALFTLMDKTILEKEYPDDLEDAKDAAESSVQSMIDTYGLATVNSYYGSKESAINNIYLTNLRNEAVLDYRSLLQPKCLWRCYCSSHFNSNRCN